MHLDTETKHDQIQENGMFAEDYILKFAQIVAEFITIIGVFDKVLLCSEELLTTLSDIKNNSQEISCFAPGYRNET